MLSASPQACLSMSFSCLHPAHADQYLVELHFRSFLHSDFLGLWSIWYHTSEGLGPCHQPAVPDARSCTVFPWPVAQRCLVTWSCNCHAQDLIKKAKRDGLGLGALNCHDPAGGVQTLITDRLGRWLQRLLPEQRAALAALSLLSGAALARKGRLLSWVAATVGSSLSDS